MTDEDHFKIYADQLREGSIEKIEETFSSEFIDVHEKDLAFNAPVSIRGHAYLAEDMLVLHIDISTIATVPCSVCNDSVDVKIAVKGFYHAVPLYEIKSGIFDFREILRETILLEAPLLTECHEGKCPQRKTLQKYIKERSGSQDKNADEGSYRPFADLDFDVNEK